MDFEKLGSFYLGKEYDLEQQALRDQLLMYDARDLTTHAVCVGMTGSGKTGLCIDLLEEAAIDKVPAIIIDPKGDMTNLLLTFPDLAPDDFRPWVNVDDARRKGLSLDEFAAQQAELWRKGLAGWGQDESRIRLLRDTVDYAIYTPGSDAGIPVSILQSFAAPEGDWDEEAELLRERIQGVVSGLLGLVGVEADPVQSRENILLANLFEHYWKKGEDLDLAKLIVSIQNPPITKLGVFDVETFFPQKERFGLAMALNNLVASPSFQSWLEGQSLDISSFLATPKGKPRHSVFYIAHLNDSERMFFVTMLLNQLISWMRGQSGTTSLRAILYMDEIFGFFPPVANPPSKRPMLTLLKQARAFGVGVVLASQNPIDLDYKGLTNTGTWFIGRLQTERDKKRLLDGLQGVSSQGGEALDREALSRTISDLGKRVFLYHSVHEERPLTFQTRWAMSYLRGPMTRTQIRELSDKLDLKPEEETAAAAPVAARAAAPQKTPAAADDGLSDTPPPLAPGMEAVYLPQRRGAGDALRQVEEREGRPLTATRSRLVYRPALLGMGRVHFVDRRLKVDESKEVGLLCEAPARAGLVCWEDALNLDLAPRDLQRRPDPDAAFEELPDSINEPKEIKRLSTELSDHLYRSSQLTLFHSPKLKVYSEPGESEREFRLRLNQAMREERDEEVDKITRRYQKKIQRLKDRLESAELALAKKEATADARKRETLISVGESILGMFLGRRSTRVASSSMSKYRMSSTAKMAAKEAEEKVESYKREIVELEEELRREAERIGDRWEDAAAELEEKPITPRRSDIDLDVFGLAWVPQWQVHFEDGAGRSRHQTVDAL